MKTLDLNEKVDISLFCMDAILTAQALHRERNRYTKDSGDLYESYDRIYRYLCEQAGISVCD